MNRVPASYLAVLMSVAVAGSMTVFAQKNDRGGKDSDNKRPKVSLRAQPAVVVAPANVVLTAELQGGADDFEDYYCPTVEWEWGDDTSSESTADCDPFEAGKSQIKRRFVVQHVFRRAGAFKVYFHMKRKEKILGSASTTIQVQPGAGAPGF